MGRELPHLQNTLTEDDFAEFEPTITSKVNYAIKTETRQSKGKP